MDKKTKKNLKEVEEEISCYQPKKRIADAMRKLVHMGFSFSGHGCGFGGEDFGMSFHTTKITYYYVSICDEGRKVSVIFTFDDGHYIHTLATGTIGKVLSFVEKTINGGALDTVAKTTSKK